MHLTHHDPPLLNFPPTLPPQAGILKAGAVGIEFLLKAKHALVLVMMGAAAAQRFTFLESLSKKRQNACTKHTRRRREPKPLGQQCPFPGLGKLDQDTQANLR